MLSDLRYRLRALFRRDTVETELDQELHFHVEKEVEKYMHSGLAEEESRRRVRLAFGGDSQIKEDCREARGTSFIETTVQDVRYALRQLRENPVFAIVMVLTLALGIGANSAIFSVIDNVLLHSLPYRHPEKLTRMFMTSEAFPKFPLNPFDFRDMRTRNRSFESMAAYTRSDMQLAVSSGDPIRVNGFRITAGFFHVYDLLGTYIRLKGLGILPMWVADHGVAIAFYYEDPDQNVVELNTNGFGILKWPTSAVCFGPLWAKRTSSLDLSDELGSGGGVGLESQGGVI